MIKSFPLPFSFRLHPLFWLLIAAAVMTGQFVQMITLFWIVLLHELGHVFVARGFGWQVHEVVLFPFGGIAEMKPGGKEDPKEEWAVVLAGPAMNLILMAAAGGFSFFSLWTPEWTLFFVAGNLSILGFNLLPIYPLDGGRLLQLLLARFLPYRRAMYASLYAGMFFCGLLLLLSLWKLQLSLQLWFVLPYLSWVLWQELRKIPYRFQAFLLHRFFYGNRVKLYPTKYVNVFPHDTLSSATRGMFRHYYHLFRVNGRDPFYCGEGQVLQEIYHHQGAHRVFADLDRNC